MIITIDAVEYAIKKAEENLSTNFKIGDYKESDRWVELYDKAFEEITSLHKLKPMPIKLYGSVPFCMDIGIPVKDFVEAFYQLDLNVQKGRKTLDSSPLFAFKPICNKEGSQLDIAINSLHPCLIKMIFAYLQKPELIDKALELIANYEKD